MKNLSIPISIIIDSLIIAGSIVYTKKLQSVGLLKEKGIAQVTLPKEEKRPKAQLSSGERAILEEILRRQ